MKMQEAIRLARDEALGTNSRVTVAFGKLLEALEPVAAILDDLEINDLFREAIVAVEGRLNGIKQMCAEFSAVVDDAYQDAEDSYDRG